MKDKILTGLNDPQREAVTHFSGPLSIIASAGSGKTRVITRKIAYLIQKKKVPARAILAVTFTNKAASEMKERVRRLTRGYTVPPTVSTFHSFGLRILRECAGEAGFDREWRVIDGSEQKTLLNRMIKERDEDLGRDTRERIRRHINIAKMNLLFPNNRRLLLQSGFQDLEADLYLGYQEYLSKNKLWDFEDLISLPVKLFQTNRTLYERYRRRFEYILVDEFQDINPNQYQLIKLLACGKKGVTVVGDEDQAIYSWRGADIGFLLRFEEDFPGSRTIKLERNYRSTAPILEIANQVINKNLNRREKKMWTDRKTGHKVCLLETYSREDEARQVTDFIEQCRRRHPEYFPLAILYRTNAQSLAFETLLSERGIPFRIIKGLRFFQRKEIRDCLSMLQTVIDPEDDRAFLRLVDFLPLGIGPKTLDLLSADARESGAPLFRVLAEKYPDKFRGRPLFPFIRQLHGKMESLSLRQILEKMLDKSGYPAQLEKKKEEGRLLNIQEFGKFLDSWKKNNPDKHFSDLMDYIQLNEGDREQTPTEDVMLLTMHNAKGLEFPCVVVSGVNQTFMPFFLRQSRVEIEEERRLFYVALTRAIRKLVISTGGLQPSMFLQDVPPSCWYRGDCAAAMFPEEPEGKSAKQKNTGSPPRQYIRHPLFGEGVILNSLGESKYFARFPDGREIVVDVSLINADILSR